MAANRQFGLIKLVLKSGWAQNLLARLASFYIRFVFATSSWKKKGFEVPLWYLENEKPFITCFWHSRLLLLPYAWPGGKETFFMLISAHKDGRLISKTVGRLGIETIAGSTQRGGTQALVEMVRLSKKGKTIGITPDGPRGPAFEVSEGTLMAAYLAKADLIPVTYSIKRHKRLNSWDRFLVPFPFSSGVLEWGEAVQYPKTRDQFMEVKKKLKIALDKLNDAADKEVNH